VGGAVAREVLVSGGSSDLGQMNLPVRSRPLISRPPSGVI
jgi:hypothetical protein